MAYNSDHFASGAQQPYGSNADTSYGPDRDLPRLPSYNSEADLGRATPQYPQQSKSPFTAPFDDHVYPAPAGPYRTTSHDPSISPSIQPSLSESTAYFGGRPQDSQNQFSDNIPLRDHSKNMQSNDNVYDIENSNPKRKGIGFGSSRFRFGNGNPTAWVVWFFTIIQVAVFIAELVKSAQLTGSPIQTKPFNPMIGPSPYVLINMGSRYTPCMREVAEITNMTTQGQALDWFCPSTRDLSSVDTSRATCRLNQVCGLNAPKIDVALSGQVKNETVVPSQEQVEELNAHPGQWFRFIIPMFLHAGVIHLLFNMLLQLTLGRDMEKEIGSVRFFIVYICAGIFGFVMGGNFAGIAVSSVGASGALFGVIALTLLDLLYTWSERPSPVKDLIYIILDIVISFVLGLLPGLDNFAHIGGFLMGLVLGVCILHSPSALRKRIGAYEPPYQGLATSGGDEQKSGAIRFVKSPMGFFKGRKGGWWAWWLVRATSLVAVLVVFIVLVRNFYAIPMHECEWCRYLSCLVSGMQCRWRIWISMYAN